MKTSNEFIIGILYAVLAIITWGLMPIYWNALNIFSALTVFACRTLFAALSLGILIILSKKRQTFIEIIRNKRLLFLLSCSALLISSNWLLYIQSIHDHKVVESSFGYYISPLLTVFLGMIIFNERLSMLQWTSFILAMIAVVYQAFNLDSIPFYALGLACTWSIYSALKKFTKLDGMISLTIETILISPFALLYVFALKSEVSSFAQASNFQLILLVGSGLLTAFPLICFTNAAKRLPLSFLGFMNYLTPSIQLMLAIFYFAEPFTRIHKISFSIIGIALLIYSYDLFSRNYPHKK